MMTGLCILAMPVWFLFGDSIKERIQRKAFDPVAWRSARHTSDPVRIRMVDDLLHSQGFHGMTRDKVTSLIGEPDDTGYFQDFDLVYWLGPERGFMGIDSEWLVFKLDGQQKVKNYQIVRD
jgi:hypothetical protein